MSEKDLSDGERYREATTLVTSLAPRLEAMVRDFLDAEGVRFHSVTARVKSPESARRKIQGSEGRQAAYEDLGDLLGLRIITYFPDEVDRVAAVVRREFTTDPSRSPDHRHSSDADRFGYASLHLSACLSANRLQLAELARFGNCRFEIQIRSILQHAWAEIEHDLGYKAKEAIPRDVRRRFARLAGLLELADDEFLAIRKHVEEYARALPSDIESRKETVWIDAQSTLEFVRTSAAIAELDALVAHRRSAALVEADLASAGRLAKYLQRLGVQTVGELAEALERHRTGTSRFIEAWLTEPLEGTDDVQRGIAVFYLCYVLAAVPRDRNRLTSYLFDSAIGPRPEALATEILEVLRDD